MESCVHIRTVDDTDDARSLTALLVALGHKSIDVEALIEGSMEGLTLAARLERLLGWQVANISLMQEYGEDSEAATGPH